MKPRHCTVGYRPVDSRSRAPWRPPAPSRMPFVRLSGRWLARAGFGIGTAVRVQVSRGRLVLEAIEPARPSRRRAQQMAGD